jgi:hypothetical protein
MTQVNIAWHSMALHASLVALHCMESLHGALHGVVDFVAQGVSRNIHNYNTRYETHSSVIPINILHDVVSTAWL